MPYRELPWSDRVRRLCEYVSKVSPGSSLEALCERLHAGAGEGAEEELAVRRTGPGDEEAIEALEVLRRDPERISPDGFEALEAIVHRTGRPAIDVIDDSYAAPAGEWSLLGQAEVRKRIEKAIPSVGRVEVPNDPNGRPYAGTGFVVGKNLLMTNRHVARIFAQGIGRRNLLFDPGETAAVDFKREVPHESASTPILLHVTRIMMIHPYWDMALLEVARLPERHQPLSLSIAYPDDLAGRRIAVIGYPARDVRNNLDLQDRIFNGIYQVKRLLPGYYDGWRDYERAGRIYRVIGHDTSTLGGNSGSALIDLESGAVVGLHFAGEYLLTNYAVSMRDLAEDPRVRETGLNFESDVEPRGSFYDPIWKEIEAGESMPGGQAITTGRGVSIPFSSGSTTIWTVPIQISVSVGTPVPAEPGGSPRPSSEWLFSRDRTPPKDYTAHFKLSDRSATGFDWRTALSMALASQLAYGSREAVEQTGRDAWGLQTCRFFEAGETQCFVASNEDHTVVCFRGTAQLRDWLANLNLIHTNRDYGPVHRGFFAAFEAVEPQLRQEIADLPNRRLLLTGHSLGGALATIAAAEWAGQFPIAMIYTYGQPAVGRGESLRFMRDRYGGSFARFVNDDDVVPRIPPNYGHVGELYHFDAAGRLVGREESVSELSNEPPTMSEAEFEVLKRSLRAEQAVGRVESVAAEEGIFPSVRDHGMHRYIEKIAAAAGVE